MNGPHFPFWWEASDMLLLSCYDGEECIFSEENLGQITRIRTTVTNTQSDNLQETFDLQGRRLNKVPAKGLYIRGVKKYLVR